MSIETSTPGHSTRQIVIAQDVPEEVRDSGRVRMGGAVHVCWLTAEIMHYLPGLLRFWPNTVC
jgi:hypothetical protein